MKFETMKTEIENRWAEKFGGKCDVSIFHCCGKSLWIEMRLSEKINVTKHNDILRASFYITLPDNFNTAEELPETMTIECQSKIYKIKPENRYLAYSSRTIPFRKTSGTAEKIILAIGKFVDRLHESIIVDYLNGNIPENYIEIVKENVK